MPFDYKALAWRQARWEKLEATAFTCEACRRNCRREPGRILVHHAIGANRYPEHALKQEYLVTLCITCHEAVERVIHHRRLFELAEIGRNPRKIVPLQHFGPVPWQFPLGLEAANDENFTLDPPLEAPSD